MKTETQERVFETVLPVSGRFASIRPLLWMDMLVGFAAKQMMMPLIMSRVCTIDGHSHTPDEWTQFEYEDIAPLVNEINRRFAGISDRKGVA